MVGSWLPWHYGLPSFRKTFPTSSSRCVRKTQILFAFPNTQQRVNTVFHGCFRHFSSCISRRLHFPVALIRVRERVAPKNFFHVRSSNAFFVTSHPCLLTRVSWFPVTAEVYAYTRLRGRWAHLHTRATLTHVPSRQACSSPSCFMWRA